MDISGVIIGITMSISQQPVNVISSNWNQQKIRLVSVIYQSFVRICLSDQKIFQGLHAIFVKFVFVKFGSLSRFCVGDD